MTASALDSVMDQAAAAADSFDANSNVPAVRQGGALTQTGGAPARPSLDSMADNTGMTVDEYLSVKEAGLRIGDMKGFFNDTEVTIDMDAVVAIFSVRATRGGNTSFIKSYDGITTSQGQNFQQATAQFQATHDKVDGPYQTAEIPATLLADVKSTKGEQVKAGTTIGITPAITGVKFWTKFYKEVREAGLLGTTVRAKIECLPQTNKNGNEWGVVGFTLLR